MSMDFRYTKHQVARGSKPDAERQDAVFLLKNVSQLRLTYQIRLLTFNAQESGRRLIIRIPSRCKLLPSLTDFQKKNNKFIRIEKV